MLHKLRHIAAALFLLLSMVVVTPVSLLHVFHKHTETSHEGHNHKVTHVERSAYKCPLCEFQVSNFVETPENPGIQSHTFSQKLSVICNGAAYSRAILAADSRGPPVQG